MFKFKKDLTKEYEDEPDIDYFNQSDEVVSESDRPSLGERLKSALFGRDDDNDRDFNDLDDTIDFDNDDDIYGSSADEHIYNEDEADLFNDPTRPDGEQYDEFL